MAKEKVKTKIYGKPGLLIPTAFIGGCPGCGHGLVQKMVAEAVEELGIEDRFVGIGGVGCGMGTFVPLNVDAVCACHGPAPAIATGIKHALFEQPIIVTAQGDGDCAAIGGGYLINAAARAERITVIMVNNGNYGTTGGQMAPTTLIGQETTTTPGGRDPGRAGYPLHVPEMLATIKGVVYCARGALDSPANFTRTKKYIKTAIQKQLDDVGFSFVEVLAACPADWHLTPLESLERIEKEMIVEFPLGEIKNVDRID